ncbi:MAG TPA: RluA family pseudouridine synthase [Ktedonobacteraceae bacterium]|jgi:23S rRNA pseudouridine1911/1915/1917 synthase
MSSSEPLAQTSRQSFLIHPEDTGQRLDRYLAAQLAGWSRNRIQSLIACGAVQVNGRASKPGYALRAGDNIGIDPAEQAPRAQQAQPQLLPLDIVYEDADLLVINKAPGMVVHPAPGHSADTLVNALLARYPDLPGAGNDRERPGIVHRLDRDTSGLLLVAKNARTQATLIAQLQRREIVKRYQALVDGILALDQGSIDAPIGRDPRHRQQMAVTAVGSRQARTHFRVLERFTRHTLLLIELETGRTHQIRVHLKAIGHPVVGDPIYGGGNALRGIQLHRQFLHACQLQLTHPGSGQPLKIEAPLPADLQAVLARRSVL